MALTMHTNYASLVSQNNLTKTNDLLNTAMERLSTGYRINSAADDAAGMQISTRLDTQTRGMSVAMRNGADAISMMQTAEGAFDEMTNIAQRMNDLALQADNGSNTAADQTALDAEFTALSAEMGKIMTNTNFGGQALLKGGGLGAAAVSFQLGTTAADALSVDVSTELGAIDTAIGGLGANAAGSAAGMQSLIETIGTARSALGANVNRVEHTVTNLMNMSENLSAAKGRITDADFAVESSSMTKNQMLMQAGTTVLSRTNQLPGMAMSLLG
ncbi:MULTISPECIES: lateral flagellin LafA [Vibrio]|uniref:lateral flagellin LafA n=1 Tax=Vibrio TaxID=662 RepID=UPI003D11FD0F